MKRFGNIFGNIFAKIIDFENLKIAHKNASLSKKICYNMLPKVKDLQ